MSDRVTYDESGFTILELIIATAVFAVVLLLATFALLRVGQTYYKGVTSSQTQDTARSIIEDISQAIEFSGSQGVTTSRLVGSPLPTGPQAFFCAGNKRYTFGTTINTNQTLVRDDQTSGCTDPGSPPVYNPGYVTLTSAHMRLAQLSVTQPVNASPNLYQVTIRLVNGDDDLLCSPSTPGDCTSINQTTHLAASDLTCKTGAGSAFCSVSSFTTTVLVRVQ